MTLPIPSQRNWSVGDIVTAAMMNANVRDAVNFLANPPIFVGVQSAVQSIATSTIVPITFDSELVDSYNGHSTSTNVSRYTCQLAGWYSVIGEGSLATSAAGSVRSIRVQVNAAGVTGNPQQQVAVGGNNMVMQASGLVFLNVGDYVETAVQQTSGGALNTVSGFGLMACLWVHA